MSEHSSRFLGQLIRGGPYRIGTTEYPRGGHDHRQIACGLAVHVSLLSEASGKINDSSHLVRMGRLKRVVALLSQGSLSVEDYLSYWDAVDTAIVQYLSAHEAFKAFVLKNEIRSSTRGFPARRELGFTDDIIIGGLERNAFGFQQARDITCLLKKIEVSRPDLEVDEIAKAIQFEADLLSQTVHRREDPVYQEIVSAMHQIWLNHQIYVSTPFVPRHGNGAVALPGIKTHVEKYLHMRNDPRVEWLLSREGLGTQLDYCPTTSRLRSYRCSRFCCVPKTWKKLRGISAEPPELQFYQQGIARAVDEGFRNSKFWNSRVNLHDQIRSRERALSGSITGSYATIDLSSASDSVTVQHVRDILGNTQLSRWLLGTRSAYTRYGDELVQISKFAPMGSACCFPTECIIFTLAAELAVRRTRLRGVDTFEPPIVYGDDIIVPYYAADECIRVLTVLGFSVNTEKSYIDGWFREACGCDAWRGTDVRPLMLKHAEWICTSTGIGYEDVSTARDFINELFLRGWHDTRAWLLKRVLTARLQGVRSPGSDTLLFAFDRNRSTVISPQPTNFHLKKRVNHALQRAEVRVVDWRRRPMRRASESELELAGVYSYTEWLIRHQDGMPVHDSLDEERVKENPYARLPIDQTMVPTYRWVALQEIDAL